MYIVDDEGWEGLSELLCSYGSQLQFVDLNLAPPEVCVPIVAACPNLRCDFEDIEEEIDVLLHKVIVMAKCVRRIWANLHCWEDKPEKAIELASALRSCTELEHLEAIGKLSLIKELFSFDMPLLVSVDLGIEHEPNLSDLFLKLSSTNLREFYFDGCSQDKGAFDPMV